MTWLDEGALALLFGMMILVGIFSKTGFSAIKLAPLISGYLGAEGALSIVFYVALGLRHGEFQRVDHVV